MVDSTQHELVFNDEFNTLSLDSSTSDTETWRPVYYWGDRTLAGNAEQQLYVDPSWNNLQISAHSVENGVLSLTAFETPDQMSDEAGGLPYMSGMINSEQSFSQQYGYFEMRAQLPEGQGFWPAFWMLPIDGGWPPELDIMEVLGHDTDTLYNTLHSNETGSKTMTGGSTTVADMSAGFHTYGVEWQKDSITFYFDGVEVFQTVTPADMHEPMYLLANLAVGGYWPGNPDASTTFPSSMKIDYIRAYQSPIDAVATEIPTAWTPISQMTFSTLDGAGATNTWSWKTTMSEAQEKLKMEGEWARHAEGNALDNWIEGGSSQYQEYDGNGGNDVLKGGSGIDVFKIQDGDGNDTILDFSNTNGNTDKVYLDGFHFSHFDEVKPFLTQLGNDVILHLDADQALKFAGITIDQLAPEQFAFFNTVAPPAVTEAPAMTDPVQKSELVQEPEPVQEVDPEVQPTPEPELESLSSENQDDGSGKPASAVGGSSRPDRITEKLATKHSREEEITVEAVSGPETLGVASTSTAEQPLTEAEPTVVPEYDVKKKFAFEGFEAGNSSWEFAFAGGGASSKASKAPPPAPLPDEDDFLGATSSFDHSETTVYACDYC